MAFVPGGPIVGPHPALDPGLVDAAPPRAIDFVSASPAAGIHYFGPGGAGIIYPQPAPPHPAEPVIRSDQGVAGEVLAHLLVALRASGDPELQSTIAHAVAALHKHLATLARERQQALQGRVSPRLMQAYGSGI